MTSNEKIKILGWPITQKKRGIWYATKRINGKVETIYIGKHLESARYKILEWHQKNNIPCEQLESLTQQGLSGVIEMQKSKIQETSVEQRLNYQEKFVDLLYKDIRILYKELEQKSNSGLKKVLSFFNTVSEIKDYAPFYVGSKFYATRLKVYLTGKETPITISNFEIGEKNFIVEGKPDIFYDHIQMMEFIGFSDDRLQMEDVMNLQIGTENVESYKNYIKSTLKEVNFTDEMIERVTAQFKKIWEEVGDKLRIKTEIKIPKGALDQKQVSIVTKAVNEGVNNTNIKYQQFIGEYLLNVIVGLIANNEKTKVESVSQNDKVQRILQDKGKLVTVLIPTSSRKGETSRMVLECQIKACDAYCVKLYITSTMENRTFILDDVKISYDDKKSRTLLKISNS